MNLILFKCFYRSGSFFFHDVNSANKNIATLPATDFLKYANTYKRHNLKKKILKKIQNQEGYFYTLRGFSKQFKEINFKNLKKDIFIDLHLLLSKNKKKKTHIFYHMHNDNEIDEIKKLKVKFDKIYFVTTVSNFNQGLKSFINHNQKKKYYILNEKINYYFRFYYFLRFLERIKLQRKLFRKFKFIRINQKNLNLNFKSTMNKYFQEINVDKKIN